MGYSSFRIDLNFAFLIYSQLLSCGNQEESKTQHGRARGSTDQIMLLRQAQDFIFEETIKRNFSQCPVDPKFYIYTDNLEDSFITGHKPSQNRHKHSSTA